MSVKVYFTDDEDGTKIELVQSNMADNDYGQVNYNPGCILG